MLKKNLKRSLVTAVTTAMLLPFPVSASAAVPGDLNNDGEVSITELQSVINAFLKVAPDAFPPTAPTNLTATPLSSTQVKLDWTAATDNTGVAGYKIYRGAALVATVSGTTYTDAGVSPASSYSYTVYALDVSGNASLTAAGVEVVTPVGTAANKLVGNWYVPYPNAGDAKGPIVFNFIDGQKFMMAHDGDAQAAPGGEPGVEAGTYTWNQTTGAFTATVTTDTNGQWGFSNAGPLTLTVSGDNNTLLVNNSAFATRVLPSGTNPLIGGWYHPDAGGAVAITFIDNTTFMLAHDGTADASGKPGIERGTYTWNQSTGAITVKVLVDTNGGWGISNSGVTTLTVSSDNKTLLVDGTSFATRIP